MFNVHVWFEGYSEPSVACMHSNEVTQKESIPFEYDSLVFQGITCSASSCTHDKQKKIKDDSKKEEPTGKPFPNYPCRQAALTLTKGLIYMCVCVRSDAVP